MRLLLDSHVLLRWLDGAERLSRRSCAAIAVGENDVFVSAATFWELAIKESVGKLTVAVDLAEHSVAQGFQELPVTGRHARAVRDLPSRHGDPFDRMLVAQAQVERLTLVTADRALGDYDVAILPA